MPHVFIFGRETSFSSDELGLVAVLGIGYRIIWVAISAVFGVSALDANDQCSVVLSNNVTTTESPLFKPTLFLGLLTGQSVVQLLLFIAMLYATTRGTIIQPLKRWAVAYIVAIMFMLELLLVGTSAFGVYVLATLSTENGVEVCDSLVLLTSPGSPEQVQLRTDLNEDLDMVSSYTLIGVIFSIINNLGFVLLLWMTLNRNRARRSKDAISRYERNVSAWSSRLRCGFRCATMFTCGIVGGISGDKREEGYRAMAEIFTDYFKDSGLSMLDSFAGLLLIRAEQKAAQHIAIADRELRENDVWTDMATAPGSPKLMLKAQSLKGPVGSVKTIKGIQRPIDHGESSDNEAHHDTGDEFADFMNDAMTYAPYMLGIYGWKLFMFMHRGSPLRSIRKIMVNRKNMGTGKVTGDNYFGCYQGAMASTMGDSIDVMHASFVCVANEQVPYVVAVDHSKKKVLLMIRGTHSLGDLFTDVILKPKEMKEAGENWGFNGEGHYAHGGFLNVAMTIREDLERAGVLHQLLGVTPTGGKRHSTPVEGITTEGVVEVDHDAIPSVSSYQLVLVGHSMGAAIAAMVGIMLRPAFPNLFCMGYSTPGTCLSLEIAEECSEWMRTVWVGKDFVARGSYRALEELRERMYDVLIRCKVNKSTVLRSLFTHMPVDHLLYTPEEAPDTPESRKLDSARARLKQRAMDSVFSKHPLYTPGKMLHLVKVETESTPHCTGISFCKKAKRRFVPTWVHDRTIVKDVQISSRMLLDHFPDGVAYTVENVAEEYCYFSPASDKLLMKMTVPSATRKKNSVQTVNPQFGALNEDEELRVIADSL